MEIHLQLQHESIIQIYSAFYEEKEAKFYMIMEIADGGDMQDLFKRNKLENRWLVESQIWMYVE